MIYMMIKVVYRIQNHILVIRLSHLPRWAEFSLFDSLLSVIPLLGQIIIQIIRLVASFTFHLLRQVNRLEQESPNNRP